MKLCIIYNGAAHYRAGIFKKLDEEFDCEWFLGPGQGNIKQLPLSFFKNAHSLERIDLPGPLFFQRKEARLMLSRQYDAFLVLGNTPNVATWLGLILHNIFNRKIKVYSWTHGLLRIRKQPRHWFEELFQKLPYATFVYGDRAKKIMISRGFDENKIFAIHNSLDYDEQLKYRGNFSDIYRSHFGNNNKTLFFIGRLTPVKKLDMLVTAVDILRNKGKDVNLVFIGDGEMGNSLKEQVESLNLNDRVWFYGPCYNEKEKSELISNADLCVAPGNIGLTAMDTLMYGTPAITMDNFGFQMPEHEAIIEGVTGSFFRENDVNDMADKIEKWFDNGLDREIIRKNCYDEIDTNWTPYYQIEVFKQFLKP